MMIKKIVDEKINWMIEKTLDGKALSLNPVLAGGFPLSVFRTTSLHRSDSEWKAFKNRVVRKSSWINSIAPFSDVDMWFLNDSKRDSFYENFEYVTTTSKWGKSYNIKNIEYQVMSHTPDSVESLINSFDLSNSMYAWHKGVFYYSESAELAFKKVLLSFNKPSVKKDSALYEKIFHSLRYFKYARRYGLDFDDNVADFVFELYLEIQELALDSKLEQALKTKNTVVSDSHYFSYSNSNLEMVSQMREKFSEFCIMETFRPEWLLFLIPSSVHMPEIKTLIESNYNKDTLSIFPVSVKIPF